MVEAQITDEGCNEIKNTFIIEFHTILKNRKISASI